MCCHDLDRRGFLGLAAGLLTTASLAAASVRESIAKTKWEPDMWDPERPFRRTGKALKVQPVLMYRVSQKKDATSWKSWGGIQTEQAASEEVQIISKELQALSKEADFALQLLPTVKVKSESEAKQAQESDCAVLLLYPATGSGQLLQACISTKADNIIYVRHQSGPIYYWYEALSVKYLNTDDKQIPNTSISVDDVVVDDYQELLWRLRALYGVKNFFGTRIVALGGAGGKYSPEAPAVAREKHKIDILEIRYDDVAPTIQQALANPARISTAEAWTKSYLSLPNTTLMTEKKFILNAFLLYGIVKDLMRESAADAFTIKECMRTIMPMAQTTACLTLSLLNDEGLPAFCESDFVIIPASILLGHISGKPVFLHNSTFPHKAIVTCAHCTSPRRMDGENYEPAQIMTHFESEYGAAPKIDMPQGNEVTFIDPEYSTGRWVGFKGTIRSNPFYDICRSQQDVEIHGEWKKLLKEARDSHWVMAYGDYLREVGYAARRIAVRWENISEA